MYSINYTFFSTFNKMKLVILYFLSLFSLCIHQVAGAHALHHRLRTWETISEDDITFHRTRRSLDGKHSTIDKQISFNAFQTSFTLSLITSPGIFAPNFKAVVQGEKGESTIDLDKTSIYQGTVLGEPGSFVHAHMQGKELIANIKTKQDIYVVEPSWRHIPEDRDKTKAKMIVYRRSDLNTTALSNHKNSSICEIDDLMKEIRNKEKEQQSAYSEAGRKQVIMHHRSKRAAGNKKICTLALVADHRFYEHMGNSNALQTMYYIVTLMDKVNSIFKGTDWGSEERTKGEYEGYGFQISSIRVHNSSTVDPSYNSKGRWTAQGLLKEFSEQHRKECLAHLFTYEDFDKGVLGLAYVGSSRSKAAGGICSGPYDQGIGLRTLHLNTGLTTAKNWGQRILTLEADLVTTHELGHNFGAEHDNGEVPECSPGESKDGNYIMYPAAVSGEYANNDKFSKCSKHNVLPVIEKRAEQCFIEDTKEFCGNYKKEDGEECDAGYLEQDECCDKHCKLRKGKVCSRKNYQCCVNCQIASNTTLCYAEIEGSCFADTYCNGTSLTCPKHNQKADKTPCGDAGECQDGRCQAFCETVNMKSCLCTANEKDFCKRCCAPSGAIGENMVQGCKPYIFPENNTFAPLRDNARCTLGYCNGTKCIKQTQDVIERVWKIFENIAPDKIGEFLADNIVGAVLVFSLILWIPCGCLVNAVDKKRERHNRREDELWAERLSDIYKFNHPGGNFGSTTALHKTQKSAAAKAGHSAVEQWNVSKEKGAAARRAQDGSDDQPTTSARAYGYVARKVDDDPLPDESTELSRLESGDAPVVTSRRISRPQLMRQDHAVEDS